ncbi:MAG TPA: DUF4129 domain-containing protein [Candidatus Binatia bacterium]|nr:DUF4129 domain-containing protein [Candidatus Binatia bacterium]
MVSIPPVAATRSARALLILTAVVASLLASTALLASPAAVQAAGCAAGYLAQLRAVAAELTPTTAVAGAVAQLQVLEAQYSASAALDPVISDLEGGQVSAARARLDTLAAALQPTAGSGCGSPYTGRARQKLRDVYSSPAFANLDAPPSTSWVQQLLGAIGSFLNRVVGALGPLASALIAVLILGTVAAVLAWRLRHLFARGRVAEPGGAAPAQPADPEAEWRRALAAASVGDFREAVRRGFRSALLSLSARGRLAVEPAWTSPELLAHARGDPELASRLAPAAAGFDAAWYSGAGVGGEDWEAERGHCQAIRALAARPAAVPGQGRAPTPGHGPAAAPGPGLAGASGPAPAAAAGQDLPSPGPSAEGGA